MIEPREGVSCLIGEGHETGRVVHGGRIFLIRCAVPGAEVTGWGTKRI